MYHNDIKLVIYVKKQNKTKTPDWEYFKMQTILSTHLSKFVWGIQYFLEIRQLNSVIDWLLKRVVYAVAA